MLPESVFHPSRLFLHVFSHGFLQFIIICTTQYTRNAYIYIHTWRRLTTDKKIYFWMYIYFWYFWAICSDETSMKIIQIRLKINTWYILFIEKHETGVSHLYITHSDPANLLSIYWCIIYTKNWHSILRCLKCLEKYHFQLWMVCFSFFIFLYSFFFFLFIIILILWWALLRVYIYMERGKKFFFFFFNQRRTQQYKCVFIRDMVWNTRASD